MRFVSKVLGLVSPRWRTMDEWLDVYVDIVAQREYSSQTFKNKAICVRHIRRGLGSEPMRSIKPHHLSTLVRSFLPDRAPTAQRVLDELRDVFTEAVANGWADANPALHVRRPAAKVTRQRLTFETWTTMRQHAVAGTVRWVEPMLLLALITGQRRGDLLKMRFDDVWDGVLHIEQQKKAGKKHGARVAIPLALRLEVIDMALSDVVELCRHYAKPGPTMLRKRNGQAFVRPEMLSYRFEETINLVGTWPAGARPSLHECRSLSERLYRKQGIDTQTLLGHKHQSMTDRYNDDRGLSAGEWKHLVLAPEVEEIP
ncbi:tyrosine-type recombinase/integrase [Rhodoferax sp.]|uniref:tyrosine-type recombinase/integrase n=1 Tax=Rhodoferax sp. TaxID=50421 RepID=UPI00374D6D5A